MAFWKIDHQVVWKGSEVASTGPRARGCTIKDLLVELLQEFEDVFETPHSLLPPRRQDHRIHLLPGSALVAVRLYQYPHLMKDEIGHQCDDILAQGIIRPSTCKFSSPVLLLKKQDDTWRFCMDYCALNAQTMKDKFPIPVINELLDELKGACHFSKLNLRCGYHQCACTLTMSRR